jgi:integrase
MAKAAWRRVAPGIYQRGEAQYQVKISRKGHSIVDTFDTFDAAERFWAKAVTEIDGGVYVDPTLVRETSLIDLLDRYEREVTPTKKGSRQEVSVLKMWRGQAWARLSMGSISPGEHIIPWRDERIDDDYAPSTISNAMNTLSAVYRYAINEWRYKVANPVTGLKRPKARKPRLVRMPPSDRVKLIEACRRGPDYLVFVVLLALETAMRQGEIRRIHWDHVFETHIHLEDTKNGESRDVPLTAEGWQVIQEIKAALPRRNSGWMFGDPDALASDGGFTQHMVQQAYKDAVAWALKQSDSLSQHYTFHDLRHVAITELKPDHVDAMDLAKTTGHKTIHILHKVYYNPAPAERAADIRARRAARRAGQRTEI